MNDSFPTTVSGVALDHFQLWFRQPVEAQDASRVPSRERPKDPCGSVQRGWNHRVGSHSYRGVAVVDEYGHFQGIVTNADILEAIVGEFRTDEGPVEPDAVQRDDGSWLIAGSMPVDEMAERLSVALPPERNYHTAAGFILDQLGHLPAVGESFDRQGWRFEVVDLDGRRIDKILASRSGAGRRRAAV